MKNGVILEDGVRPDRQSLSVKQRRGGTAFGTCAGDSFAEAAPVTLTIHEGKFHQVKRMFEALAAGSYF